MMDAAARKTVPVDPAELSKVHLAMQDGTPWHAALVRRCGPAASRSEAATLQALIGIALHTLGEEVAERDYKLLAASRDTEDAQYDQAVRSGRPRR